MAAKEDCFGVGGGSGAGLFFLPADIAAASLGFLGQSSFESLEHQICYKER